MLSQQLAATEAIERAKDIEEGVVASMALNEKTWSKTQAAEKALSDGFGDREGLAAPFWVAERLDLSSASKADQGGRRRRGDGRGRRTSGLEGSVASGGSASTVSRSAQGSRPSFGEDESSRYVNFVAPSTAMSSPVCPSFLPISFPIIVHVRFPIPSSPPARSDRKSSNMKMTQSDIHLCCRRSTFATRAAVWHKSATPRPAWRYPSSFPGSWGRGGR